MAANKVALFKVNKIRGTHPYSFRSGEWAKVKGIAMIQPDWVEPRLAFICEYADGVIDYMAVDDFDSNYEIKE